MELVRTGEEATLSLGNTHRHTHTDTHRHAHSFLAQPATHSPTARTQPTTSPTQTAAALDHVEAHPPSLTTLLF